MDKNGERTDRFFRERLSNFEEMPEDQIWNKIASRLETDKRRKMVFLFLRIAAGMALLLSLGLGYYLVNKTDRQTAQSGINNSSSARHFIPSVPVKKQHNPNISQPGLSSVDSEKKAEESRPQDFRYTAALIQPVPQYVDVPGLTILSSLKPGLFPVPVPQRLGYRRLSKEEMLNQLTALTSEYNDQTEDEADNANRWMLGSEIAPLYSYRTIESDHVKNNTLQAANKSEQGVVSMAGGFRVGYAAGRRLSVQSGIYYSRYGQEKNNVEVLSTRASIVEKNKPAYLSIPNSTGTIYSYHGTPTEYDKILPGSTNYMADLNYFTGFPAINSSDLSVTETGLTATQYFDYIELPVTVKYKIINRKISLSLLGGIITNFLVNNTVRLKQDGNTESFGKTADINKVNYQGSVGLGLEYPIVDRMAVSLEPRFRYYLNPIDQLNNVHPYSFGIFAGFSYSLK